MGPWIGTSVPSQVYDWSMAHPASNARSKEWFRADAERNERARRERLQIDGRKGMGQNIEEGVALITLGNEVRRAFSSAVDARPAA